MIFGNTTLGTSLSFRMSSHAPVTTPEMLDQPDRAECSARKIDLRIPKPFSALPGHSSVKFKPRRRPQARSGTRGGGGY